MHNKLKKLLLGLFNTTSGFIIFWILPIALMTAFNKTHANGNNPDGNLASPVGWLVLLALILFFVLLWVINIQYSKKDRGKKYLLFFIVTFAFGVLIAIFVTCSLYSWPF
ncbi:MAG TPA: hypothetical protein H9694_09605 [Firmicutes bacterium]|nr:hypothetical protein [Bacillota bacterium]